MPRILAIDWDRNEVRGLLISAGATGTSFSGAWTASLATAEPEGLSGKQIGSRLAAAIAGQVSGKTTTLVAIGRDHVQIKLLSLPPAPADELPDLVRFQSEREFTALGSEAALDFVPITGDAQTPHQVLALALSPTGLAEAKDICEAIGVEPDRIPVRGCAAAAFATRAGGVDAGQVVLVVNPLAEEADLVVQADDKIILLRTVRLPDLAQKEGRQRALSGEIRRTIAAARQQTERQVTKVIVCGNDASVVAGGSIGDDLDIPVLILDPVAQAPAGLSSKGLSPENLGRFAAVLGLALGEADRQRPIVDFANVRKRVDSRRFTRMHILAAAAAACVLLAAGLFLWQQMAGAAGELARLQQEIRDTETKADGFKTVTAQAAAINRWLATDVNWLDELEQTARRIRPEPLTAKNFPVAKDALLTQVTINRSTGQEANGGRMVLQGAAKNAVAVKEIEDRLRDANHHVTTDLEKQDKTIPGYDWAFGLAVHAERQDDQTVKTTKP
jgi:hypothetical protein